MVLITIVIGSCLIEVVGMLNPLITIRNTHIQVLTAWTAVGRRVTQCMIGIDAVWHQVSRGSDYQTIRLRFSLQHTGIRHVSQQTFNNKLGEITFLALSLPFRTSTGHIYAEKYLCIFELNFSKFVEMAAKHIARAYTMWRRRREGEDVKMTIFVKLSQHL